MILFDLCNDSEMFQHYMNDIFRDFLDEFLIIYLNDLLVYFKTLKKHKQHVWKILERLHDTSLYLKLSKYMFHVQEIAFLDFVIDSDDMKMNFMKIEFIIFWSISHFIHDIQVFLDFISFYYHFIDNFNHIITFLINFLKKNKKFHWNKSIQKSFEKLKTSSTIILILQHFDSSLEIMLETDISNRVMEKIIFQRDSDDMLHLIIFFNRKFNDIELNYEIFDKKMLVIVEIMNRYRYYFEDLDHKTTIYTNHRNFLWFTEMKIYNHH